MELDPATLDWSKLSDLELLRLAADGFDAAAAELRSRTNALA